MKLPPHLMKSQEWTLIGPMGPEVPENLLTHSILGVDGGARFCSHMDAWVGDGDSHSLVVKSDHKFEFPPQKSSSDLALSFSLLSSCSGLTLHLWGFLGGRKDHELVNLGEALRFLEQSPSSKIYFYDSSGRIIFKCQGKGHWNFNHQGIFSLACMKGLKVKITGNCDYQLKEETDLPPFSSLGLSNVAQGEFSIVSNGPFLLIFPENK